MKIPVELDVVNDNFTSIIKALIDLDDISFVTQEGETWVDGKKFECTRMKFKGSAYVIVALPYEQVRDLVIGSRVNSIMFEEEPNGRRNKPVQPGEGSGADASGDAQHRVDR